MLIVETIGRIRREHFVQGKSIKEIARALKLPAYRPIKAFAIDRHRRKDLYGRSTSRLAGRIAFAQQPLQGAFQAFRSGCIGDVTTGAFIRDDVAHRNRVADLAAGRACV